MSVIAAISCFATAALFDAMFFFHREWPGRVFFSATNQNDLPLFSKAACFPWNCWRCAFICFCEVNQPSTNFFLDKTFRMSDIQQQTEHCWRTVEKQGNPISTAFLEVVSSLNCRLFLRSSDSRLNCNLQLLSPCAQNGN
jgi:hypothetical protein